ncbi:MAG: epoxyqueuosine reductase QueH [Planctomycetia bacterium]|nr:epoxyqueuosine reductase QueH [Planctomycetia bacterium]
MTNDLLLHICCAPCSIACIDSLRAESLEMDGFWFNPNIHPYTEYKARKETLISYAQQINLNLILEGEYGLRPFVRKIYPHLEERCEVCYRWRLEKTAQYASEHGYTSFSTTLLISPYQKHELIIAVGKEMAARYNIAFLYRDFRPFFRSGQNKARELGLYRQKYCGCIFSEEERYLS